MNRGDKTLYSLTAACVVASLILFALVLRGAGSRSLSKSASTDVIEKHLGRREFLSLFASHLSPKEAELLKDLVWERPEDTSSGGERNPAGSGETKRFGELPIPESIGSIRWKEGSIFDLAQNMAQARGQLKPLEIHLAMRAMVARLRQDNTDLDAAIHLSRQGAKSETCRLIIIALGRTGSEKATDFLSELAKDSDISTRELAILSLAQNGLEPYLDATPESLDGIPYVVPRPTDCLKGKAARVLPDLLSTEADPRLLLTLIGVLDRAQENPRWGLGRESEVDGKRVTELIVGYALSSSDVEVRRAAVQGLQFTNSPTALTALSQIVVNDPDAEARHLATVSLSESAEDEQVFKALMQAASADPIDRVRVGAASALSPKMCGVRRRDAEELSIKLYRQERSSEVRWVWVRNFGGLGEEGRVYLQEIYTGDTDPAIRKFAADLLEKLK